VSRAHVAGFDTNADQFARMGNPWITEHDRREMPTETPPRPIPAMEIRVRAVPRTPKVRTETIGFAEVRRRAEFLKAFKSGLPGGTISIAPSRDAPEPAVLRISPGAEARLEPLSSEALARDQAALAARAAAARAECDRINRLRVQRFADVMADALGE
jgi:hypothetical protein